MNGKIKMLVALAGVLAGALAVVAWRNHQLGVEVRELKFALQEARPAPGPLKPPVTNGVVKAEADAVESGPRKEPELKVIDFRPCGSGVSFSVTLSEWPDMEAVKEYVSVEPLTKGKVSFAARKDYHYDLQDHSWNQCVNLEVYGEFAFRTNLTVRIRKGLPARSADGVKPLAEDFVRVFTREDLDPSVGFADRGRYLPPMGERSVRVLSTNVTNLNVDVYRLESANIVQLLARDESEYDCVWRACADSRYTAELADLPYRRSYAVAHPANVEVSSPITVVPGEGRSANGVFLVRLTTADSDDCCSPSDYRLVAISDLALSVRHVRDDEWGVWVTSLSSGVPVAGAKIDVYSSANIRVMTGLADAHGWCELKWVHPGEPFAAVVASADGEDMTFLALKGSALVDETPADGARRAYLKPGETEAFLWTERGIYRHDERIFLGGILRDWRRSAPRPFPVELRLLSPVGRVFKSVTAMPGAMGTFSCEEFSVPAEQPGGVWTLVAKLPGPKGKVLGNRKFRVEEFAPPQIRVRVLADQAASSTNFGFAVTAEHLFGGPAAGLLAEGAVVFEDVPFQPEGWAGWGFGSADRGLKPNFRKLASVRLDSDGRARFTASLDESCGRPKAAVKMIAQGVVFEDGGRPATMRTSATFDCYPYYLGSTLPSRLRRHPGVRPRVRIAAVRGDGRRLAEVRPLRLVLERVETTYCYRSLADGGLAWDSVTVRVPCGGPRELLTSPDADLEVELPLDDGGEYALTVESVEDGVAFARTFEYYDRFDELAPSASADPRLIELKADRDFYRVGETPRIFIRAPFAGCALMSVMRDGMRYSEVFDLTNATSEVTLRPVTVDDAPNLDVSLSVVQGAGANAKGQAMRSHGQVVVAVRPLEDEIPVKVVAAAVTPRRLEVEVSAPGADEVTVTVVDEGVNLLTDEPVPDPVGYFAACRDGGHSLYDLYDRILPVVGEPALVASGVKTGGDTGVGLLGRVSPNPTRRFRPLALWRRSLAVVDGRAEAVFELPEFAGEVRVTAVAGSVRATGAGFTQVKVSPKLVIEPDAPRFVAPGDRFAVTVPVHNRSGEDGAFDLELSADGAAVAKFTAVPLARDGFTNAVTWLTAPAECGELAIGVKAAGFGEAHDQTLYLPVRPAVAWVTKSGVIRTNGFVRPAIADARTSYRVFDSPVGELAAALSFLADYPHGCLEQTTSRIFPLLAGGAILEAAEPAIASNRLAYVEAGVRRVELMVRKDKLVMWPDVNCEPWDDEVSLYALDFLVEARRCGIVVDEKVYERVLKFLRRWAVNSDNELAAYALAVLARAGESDRDRMYRLYDGREQLSLLARARLARGFVAVRDRARAETLMKDFGAPSTVKEAAFLLMALAELEADDGRMLPLVAYLAAHRDAARFSWGTTADNAHALLAMGGYYRLRPPRLGERLVAWSKLELPPLGEVRDEACGLKIARTYLSSDGRELGEGDFRRGALVVVELAVSSDVDREVNDLVIEDLFPAAFEPVLSSFPIGVGSREDELAADQWVMRSDARDDRMLVFSRRFTLKRGKTAVFRYPVRVVSAGEFVLPGPSVEAMYAPSLHAHLAPARITVKER